MAASATDDRWLSGSRVLVTGAAGVLGRALVAEADRRGARVVATGRRPNIDTADASRRGDQASPPTSASPTNAVDSSTRPRVDLGGLDIVVNNAATLVRRAFRELELDDLEAAWEVNLRAPALIMQESFEYLREAEAPAIVNVVSTAGVNGGIATVSAYGMSKAGLIVLTKAVAREYGPHGIRVFALSPPSLDSEMQRSLPAEHRERVRSMNVLGRLAPPEEVARFTLLTASGAGGLVTGTMVDLTATAY